MPLLAVGAEDTHQIHQDSVKQGQRQRLQRQRHALFVNGQRWVLGTGQGLNQLVGVQLLRLT